MDRNDSILTLDSGRGSVSETDILTLWADALESAKENDPGATLGTVTFNTPPPEPERGGDGASPDGRSAAENGKITYTVNESIRVSLNRMIVRSADGDDASPARLDGDFFVRERLGQGGMGIIYTARQNSLDREVAVKTISPGVAGRPDARQKMISEALVTGQLDHPNIIPIYELGQTEADNLFYAMKVVRGKPWSTDIKQKTRRENVDILLRVADAVAFAHAKGIIHRDLKPANVMLGDFGEVLVMDWGLAVGLGPGAKAEQLSPANAVAGTPAYMAPEMGQGAVHLIGTASDIYLLGAILFEITTGQRPHAGANHVQRIRAAAENAIVPHSQTDELTKVALKAMATNPADRYASVKELQTAINEVQTHNESLVLAADAAEYLRRAELEGDYELYAQAKFAYQEAAKLWSGNAEAIRGVTAVRKKYAVCAFAKDDFDLALANLEGLDDADAKGMAARVSRARVQARAKQRRVRILAAAAFGLASGVVMILAFAGMVINDRMERERVAKELVMRQALLTRLAQEDAMAVREREKKAIAGWEQALERERAAKAAAEKAEKEYEAALQRMERR